MDRVAGIGGIFFTADDPEALYAWYERHLGLKREADSGVLFRWRETVDSGHDGMTVWAIFPKDTDYFRPGRASYMINYRVADLDGLLEQLRAEGVTIDQSLSTCSNISRARSNPESDMAMMDTSRPYADGVYPRMKEAA